jgi:Fic family protein
MSSLIEEAITSSQLEGASTTRVVAKEMIRSGRAPRDRSERMILNNFLGMERIRSIVDRPLTPYDVLDLHRLLTEGTMDDPTAAGRLQRPDEPRVGVYDIEGNLLHQPPPADQLPERLEKLCRLANGEIGPDGFLHPVVRSILVHFFLAYDHPFKDGNGRTARALFYWSMLRQGYWLAEFLSISRILRKAPAQYGRAYLYVETDDHDTTYFILYNLGVICRAINELHEYLQRKMREVREVEAAIRRAETFNRRQLALLGHALRHPDTRYTFRSHALSHGVTHEAARQDLQDLARRDLLQRGKVGREFVFEAAPDLAARVQRP